jgi:hypothetical protein
VIAAGSLRDTPGFEEDVFRRCLRSRAFVGVNEHARNWLAAVSIGQEGRARSTKDRD